MVVSLAAGLLPSRFLLASDIFRPIALQGYIYAFLYYNQVDLPPLVSVEATEVFIPIENREVLIADVYKPEDHTWSDANVLDLLSLRIKSLLADNLTLIILFEAVKFQILQVRNV
jgi:hypothetical protein